MEYQRLLAENPYIAAIIFFGVAVIGLASFTDAVSKLHIFITKLFHRKQSASPEDPLSEQLEMLKREIRNTGIVNNMPVVLSRLLKFFIEADLVSSPKFAAFYSKWLTHPAIELGAPALVPGLFVGENMAQLISELDELKI